MGAAPPKNLPPEAIPYVSWLERMVLDHDTAIANSSESQTNTNKAQVGITETLADQIQGLEAAVTYLDGLTTTSAAGANFNTGTTPGDSTFRWADSTPALTIQTMCPTGKLLVTIGTGQCTLQAGDSSALALVSFVASTPSGWSVALDTYDSRLFLGPNGYMGVPLVVNAPLTGVPTTELVTITVKYGIWSSSNSTLASANFLSNYVIAQVTG